MMRTGKVILAGAGPGDPELITWKALRFLQEADVVLADRLVSPVLLMQWANPKAELIVVGKESGNPRSFDQKDINGLLVKYAAEGKLVLRLKGGDIAFFSNILDELQVLGKHGIPYELIPGITAASGASAYAGIPLTARGFSGGVRFITLSSGKAFSEAYWTELAATEDTLVFYMSGRRLDNMAKALKKHGIPGDKKIAVIEQATTPHQRVWIYDFEDLRADLSNHSFVSPTLIIVGRVVALQEQLNWFHPEHNAFKTYFPRLEKQVLKAL